MQSFAQDERPCFDNTNHVIKRRVSPAVKNACELAAAATTSMNKASRIDSPSYLSGGAAH